MSGNFFRIKGFDGYCINKDGVVLNCSTNRFVKTQSRKDAKSKYVSLRKSSSGKNYTLNVDKLIEENVPK